MVRGEHRPVPEPIDHPRRTPRCRAFRSTATQGGVPGFRGADPRYDLPSRTPRTSMVNFTRSATFTVPPGPPL